MWEWIGRTLFMAVLGGAGFLVYSYYQSGYRDMPDVPDGAFPMSFKGGIRGFGLGMESSGFRFGNH
jgi:hypothetical protein